MLNRRSLLRSLALSPALLRVPAVLRRSRGDALRLAVIGPWNRGRANLEAVLGERVVALCDVDSRHLEHARKLVQERGGEEPRTYRDYRELLASEPDLDGVVVSTPDHTHACIAADAMRRGRHVYVEKPLAHSVHEVRALQRLATARGLATQMGTQIHAGGNYRRVVERIRSGVLGEISEVHVWVGKSWSGGRLRWPQPVPSYLDWDLWQGPAAARPYQRGLHPANWRRFWDYGTGTLGDMACHYVDLVHWALDLGQPSRVEAEGPAVHPIGTPERMHVTWHHPARGERGPVRVHWYDGGLRPEGVTWDSGQLFVGTHGQLLSDYGRHELSPGKRFDDIPPPPRSIPDSIGHHAEWLRAIRDGSPTTCAFAYSGDLTTTVLLGNVAYRLGRPIEWDANAGRVIGVPEAEALIRPAPRAGFPL
jgi:predicted dehydrogenase